MLNSVVYYPKLVWFELLKLKVLMTDLDPMAMRKPNGMCFINYIKILLDMQMILF
jgi:hypothetical protein